jgi:hypothetical protein
MPRNINTIQKIFLSIPAQVYTSVGPAAC